MTYLLQVRRPDLSLFGQIPYTALYELSVDVIPGQAGTWKVVGPRSPILDALALSGYGLVVTTEDGNVLASGPTDERDLTESTDEPNGTWTITGEDDTGLLYDRLLYPTPTTTLVDDAQQQGTDGTGIDTRTGKAESVLRAYVDANAGPSAPAERRIPYLQLEPDQATGSDITAGARFDQAGDFLSTAVATPGGVGFRLLQVGDHLKLRVLQPRDLTGKIKLSVANGTLTTATLTVRRPEITRALVMGAGEDADRVLLEVTTPDSLAAEALWGRRIERTVDSGGTLDPDELTKAGTDALADTGKTIISATVQPVDTDEVQFGRDYYLLDRVTVTIGGQDVQDTITGARFELGTDGLTVSAILGDPSTAIRDITLRSLLTARAEADRRLGRIERT